VNKHWVIFRLKNVSDHNALKLEINNKNRGKKHANNWKLNNTLLNDQWVIDEIKEEIKVPGS
jgi:hypothetical protein